MANTYQGIAIIKRWEKCILRAYKPIPTDPWTVGWGSTGPNIVEGTQWTQGQADADLQNKVAILSNQLSGLIKVPINDYQYGAIISLAYNIGITEFKASTLLRLLNQENYEGASMQFLVWNKSDGRYVQGLMNRREDEQHVFDTPTNMA